MTISTHSHKHWTDKGGHVTRRGIEKVFGWIKQWGGLRQFKLRGTETVGALFGLHVIAYNLIRLGNLLKLVEALGGTSGISKSEVSRICQGLDEQVKAFLGRPSPEPNQLLPSIYTELLGR